MTRRPSDTLTRDLFEVPQPAHPVPGSHDYRSVVAGMVSAALDSVSATKDRYMVAAEMSRLLGREISKYMLDAYSSIAREEYNLPFHTVAAFEAVTGTHMLTSWLAEKRGARVYIGREALKAELGQLEAQQETINKSIRELKRRLNNEGEA